MLIEAHPFAHDRGLTDDHAGAVVDEEAAPDRRAGMNVDAGARIGEFGDDARDDRRAEAIERVGDPVMQDRGGAGIADQHLVDAARRRVADQRGGEIGVEQAADVRQFLGEQRGDLGRQAGVEGVRGLVLPIGELDAGLFLDDGQCVTEPVGDEAVFRRWIAAPAAQADGVERVRHCLHQRGDACAIGESVKIGVAARGPADRGKRLDDMRGRGAHASAVSRAIRATSP